MLKKFSALFLAFSLVGVAAPISAQPSLIKPAWDSDDSVALTNRITETVNRVAMAYPEVRGITVTSLPLPIGVYAVAGKRRIAVNDLYFSWSDIVNKMVQYDVQEGFHPPLGRCEPAEFLALHESAHIIDQARQSAIRFAALALYSDLKGLSGYSYRDGQLNPGEAVAEAFAAVQCGGGNEAEQKLYALFG